MAVIPELLNNEDWKGVLSSVDTVLFDCDGVLFLSGNQCVPGAQELVRALKEQGKKMLFVTNSSRKSRRQFHERFTKLGFDGIKEEDVFCTASVAAIYLRDILKLKGKVYLLGLEGMQEELQKAGLEFTGHGPDPVEGDLEDWMQWECDPDVKAVLVGFDSHFSYMKMIKAASYIMKRDCVFVGTNLDALLPMESDCPTVIPGTGSMIAAISHVVQREPDYVVGKPSTAMLDVMKEMTHLDPSRALFVGDTLETDIVFGNQAGMKTLAVLTGVAKRADISAAEGDNRPDLFTSSVSTFCVQ